MAYDSPIHIGLNLDTAGFLSAMNAAPRKAARAVYNVVKANSVEAANKAKLKLTQIQNPKRGPEQGQKGGLAQSIHATRPEHHGSTIFADVRWGLPYGPIVERGPQKKVWNINAKYVSALRFGWPNAPTGGFTATVAGKTKSGERIMALTENVFYFKRVRHVDRPSHRRVHVKPAIEQQEPIFMKDLLRIPGEVLR